MATERKRPGKSETLTIRLDPKTRFMLEFISRLRGQTITTVVERAITEAANNATIPVNDINSQDLTWRDLWDSDEGVRALRVCGESALFPTYEEEKILEFIGLHHEFFFNSRNWSSPIRHNFAVLWPNISKYVEIFKETKSSDYFAAGKAMQEDLRFAKLQPPAWPSQPTKPAEDEDPPF